jgi:hypothetical protein
MSTTPEAPPAEPQRVEAVALSGEDAELIQELDRAIDDMEMLIEFDALVPEGRI